MKKITALVLAIIMTAAFTGCAPKEEPAAIEEPQATPEPEPQEVESTIEQNPVSAFYTGYKPWKRCSAADLKMIKARKRRIH